MTAPPKSASPQTASAVFDELDRLAADQHAALEAGDDDRLLAAVGAKQRLLSAVDLPALLRSAPEDEIADLRDRLDALLCDEAADLDAAKARRDELAGELAGVAASTPARAAYADGDDVPTRLDVGG